MKAMLPYIQLMRLDKPWPILLLLWPMYWALVLASQGMPSLKNILIFTLGAIIMRSAGAAVNDLIDRKLDPHVARTATRPLAAKTLSVRQAIGCIFVLLSIALILVLQLNTLAIAISVIAVLMTAFYPFCKRFTHFPQVVLGFSFNLGILMAFAAVQAQLNVLSFLLLASACCYTIAYDTIYAMADQEDDQAIGILSTALFFGQHSILMIRCFETVMIALLALIGYLLHFSPNYFVILAAVFTIAMYQISKLHLVKNREDYIRIFSKQHILALIILIAIYLR